MGFHLFFDGICVRIPAAGHLDEDSQALELEVDLEENTSGRELFGPEVQGPRR